MAYHGEEPALGLVRGLLTAQGVEDSSDVLADMQRQQDHAEHQAYAQRSVMYPVVIEEKYDPESHSAEQQRLVKIGLAVSESMAEYHEQIGDVQHGAVITQVAHERGRGPDIDQGRNYAARRQDRRSEINPAE